MLSEIFFYILKLFWVKKDKTPIGEKILPQKHFKGNVFIIYKFFA